MILRLITEFADFAEKGGDKAQQRGFVWKEGGGAGSAFEVPCFELHAGKRACLGNIQGSGHVAARVAEYFQLGSGWRASASVENR